MGVVAGEGPGTLGGEGGGHVVQDDGGAAAAHVDAAQGEGRERHLTGRRDRPGVLRLAGDVHVERSGAARDDHRGTAEGEVEPVRAAVGAVAHEAHPAGERGAEGARVAVVGPGRGVEAEPAAADRGRAAGEAVTPVRDGAGDVALEGRLDAPVEPAALDGTALGVRRDGRGERAQDGRADHGGQDAKTRGHGRSSGSEPVANKGKANLSCTSVTIHHGRKERTEPCDACAPNWREHCCRCSPSSSPRPRAKAPPTRPPSLADASAGTSDRVEPLGSTPGRGSR